MDLLSEILKGDAEEFHAIGREETSSTYGVPEDVAPIAQSVPLGLSGYTKIVFRCPVENASIFRRTAGWELELGGDMGFPVKLPGLPSFRRGVPALVWETGSPGPTVRDSPLADAAVALRTA